MPTLGFLHSAEVHVQPFLELLGELGPDISAATVVDSRLLADARSRGPASPEVVAGLEQAFDHLDGCGADLILCTCSTIGDTAERLGAGSRTQVVRVDRPMAERAIRIGTRVAVIGTLESTFGPTRTLLESAAARHGTRIELSERVAEGAWERFECRDIDGYLSSVSAAVECIAASHDVDVIALAQVSMAGAADLAQVDVPVLSSPRSGVTAAVAALEAPGRTGPTPTTVQI